MVVKKRLDYGFQGYGVPTIPRGPRSVRRRGSRKRYIEDSQICAFELLAAVAGKLLLESESSASSNAEEGKGQLDICIDEIRQKKFEEEKALRSEFLDQGSCVESALTPDSAVREHNSKSALEDVPCFGNDTCSDFSKDVNLDLKLEICNKSDADGDLPQNAGGQSSKFADLSDTKFKNGTDGQVADVKKETGDTVAANSGSVKDPTDHYVNNNAIINSECSVQLPLYRDPLPSASFAKRRNDVKLGITIDDDENSIRYDSTKMKAFRPRLGYRRIRKVLASKYWNIGRKRKDSEFSNSYEGMKPFYRNRKILYARDRCQHEAPSKRRKLCGHSFVVAGDQVASSESISNLPEKGVKADNKSSTVFSCRASGPSVSVKSIQKSRNNVKFSIKSFKVPELYIEVPETATVGALKRTVMEAVTSILGGGLRVGVLLQGKKVRDDYRTLQQAGISDSSSLENLGFTLEPSFKQVSPFVSPKQPPISPLCDADRRLPRLPAEPNLELGLPISSTSNDPPVPKLETGAEVNHELAPSPPDAITDGTVQDSKALVHVPAMNVEALAVVAPNQKSKRSELSQRRTRRPFSVAEVEALVEAVEKLGTGRWRDVKMRAFESADHRTYVDLKDKWKTLVHTASISPQQRRGEPVPQELLDRVLTAHAYWSPHQSKQHGKHHVEALRITNGQVEGVGA